MRKQRAVIIIKDSDDGGIHADVTFEPSIKNRTTESPCVNAALRLSLMIKNNAAELVAPIQGAKPETASEPSVSSVQSVVASDSV